MKLHLPLSLRPVLVTASLIVVNFTIAHTYMSSDAESDENLPVPSLDELPELASSVAAPERDTLAQLPAEPPADYTIATSATTQLVADFTAPLQTAPLSTKTRVASTTSLTDPIIGMGQANFRIVESSSVATLTLVESSNSASVATADLGTYDADAGYILTSVDASSESGFFIDIPVYDATTGAYVTKKHQLTFSDTLGDDFRQYDTDGDTKAIKSYVWVKTDGKYSLKESSSVATADLNAYSSNNVRVMGGATSVDIKHSFLSLGGESITQGGAIYNSSNKLIGDITGDFIANSASAYGYADAEAYGGAIYNILYSTIGAITGDFIANSASTDAYADAYAQGGAIYNYNNSTIGAITGDFIANSASASAFAGGGAIYNVSGTIAFLAQERSMHFSGNYISTDGGKSKTYEAIYNKSGSLFFNAYGSNSITVNDRINGHSSYVSRQIISINNGIDGFKKSIDAGGLAYGTVVFNATIINHSITVHNGTLELGSYTGSDADGNKIESSGTLVNSNLTVEANGSLNAKSAAYLGVNRIIENEGSITLGAGTLSSSVSSTSGTVNINGDITLAAGRTLTYTGSGNKLSGDTTTSSIDKISGETTSKIIAETDSDLHIDHLSLTGLTLEAQAGSSISLDQVNLSRVTLGMAGSYTLQDVTLENVTLTNIEIASAGEKNFTSSEGFTDKTMVYELSLTGAVFASTIKGALTLDLGDIADFDTDKLVAFHLSGVDSLNMWYHDINLIINDETYKVLGATRTGLDGVTGDVVIYVPEPSTAAMSLLALASLLARRRRAASYSGTSY